MPYKKHGTIYAYLYVINNEINVIHTGANNVRYNENNKGE